VRRTLALLLGLAGVWLAASGGAAGRQRDGAPPAPDRQLLDTYCVTCHDDRLRTAGLTLQSADLGRVGADPAVWEHVVRKLRGGQMPPAGRPRPDAAAIEAFVAALEAALDRASALAPDPGRPVTRRLNRTEYGNAIRDLLAIEVDAAALLPSDDTDRHGFDNNGEVLSISPMLLERYLSAARAISRLAVGRPPAAASIDTYPLPARLDQDDRAHEQLPFGSRGGAAITHHFPVDGEYRVALQLQKTLYNAVRGLAEPHVLEVRVDRERVGTFAIGGGAVVPPPASFAGTLTWNPEWEKYANHADAGLEIRIPVKAGSRAVGISFVKQTWVAEDVAQPPRTGWGFGTDEMFDASPRLERVTIEGPLGAAGTRQDAARSGAFVCWPRREAEEEACARRILSTLARRAYRRPATGADVDTLLGFYRAGRAAGRFDAGLDAALQRLLVSPDFLFRIELDPEGARAPYRISDLALASRLSFFLWSSVPDEELLDLAVRGELWQPATLDRQVRRMLADRRARALVDNFAAEWLQLRDLRNVVPDPDLFPEWDESLREAFRQETELFIEDQLRADRSVVDLISADYTFVNERLARFYGLSGVYGSRFRRVPTPVERGGLLGHASVLTLSSYPNRTSPVLRGKWLLENILGTPPPPPPPDVPALRDKGTRGERQSVRERLQEHRRNAACAACHAQMDPLGFALEHFNAIGMWRAEDEARTKVDAAGALPGGDTFEGLGGLKALLMNRRQQFMATVTERLLAYSLGRGIEHFDQPAVRQIVRDTARQDDRWSALVLNIVRSVPFQMRRPES